MVHALPSEFQLPPPGSVLDVGCGLQPQELWKPTREGPTAVAFDAHLPYLEKLRDTGYDGVLIHATWDTFMPSVVDDSFDVVVALDFIEHLKRNEGKRFLKEAQRVGKAVVIYTPNGDMEQSEDRWNLGGEEWQTHRSAWTAQDFPKSGWRTLVIPALTDPDGTEHEALWAVTV